MNREQAESNDTDRISRLRLSLARNPLTKLVTLAGKANVMCAYRRRN